MTHDDDVRLVVAAVKDKLPEVWTAWPGGRKGEIEAALLDAVLSIRSRYGRAAGEGREETGVRKAVTAYRTERGNVPLDDLAVLAAFDPERLQTVLGNRQKTSGVPKAAAIVSAASALMGVGVRHAADVDGGDLAQRRAYRSVHGLGKVTWTYFTMLLGTPGVKADTWICRFVGEAIDRTVGSDEATELLQAAATELGKSPTDLDHAIWSHMRTRRG